MKLWICESCGKGTKYEQDTRFENNTGDMLCLDCIEQEEVVVIASVYEWICPVCKLLNRVIAFSNKVVCQECDRTFDANVPEHCYE